MQHLMNTVSQISVCLAYIASKSISRVIFGALFSKKAHFFFKKFGGVKKSLYICTRIQQMAP